MMKNKKLKFLAICNPDLYKSPPLDVPTFYRQLSEDSRIDFYHLPTDNVFTSSSNNYQIQVAPVPNNLTYKQMLKLNSQAEQWHDIESFDLVFCRTLKPFPDNYLQQLSTWETHTKFVNTPSHKIEQIEADFLFKVAGDYLPDTIITEDYHTAFNFWDKHQIIVAKQVNSCGGRGVFKISHQDGLFVVDNFNLGTKVFNDFIQVIEYAKGSTNQPLQLVRYLKQVGKGDKRVVVVDGEIYGAYIRRSQSGHWVNNVSGDGECILSDVSESEKEAIANTVVHYQRRGLHTLGYDFLMDDDGNWRISEINAGNIGGFARLQQLTGKPVMKKFIDWLIDYSLQPNVRENQNYLVRNKLLPMPNAPCPMPNSHS